MRLTIERIRTLVLVAAALLLLALGVFLVRAKLKNVLNRHDLPQRLAKGIVQEADGYTVVHAFGAHSQYRIHASREVELKNDFVELHDVQIDLYGADGNQIDHISGDTFQYNQKTGLATAQGPVEMLLTRPSPSAAAAMETAGKTRGHVIADVDGAAGPADRIDVKTSGVTFDRNSGLVTTAQQVNFSTAQGSGSAMGASYNSQSGFLTLNQAVELTTHRGVEQVQIHAQHAELDRGAQTCDLVNASADYQGGKAEAAAARILFRADGSAQRLDAKGGFTIATANGGHLASPVAWMNFDQHSEPLHGHMEGGVTMDSASADRTMHATSPTAELAFGARGQLKSAHLERGVEMKSEESSQTASGDTTPPAALRVSRTWRSPIVDIGFRSATGTAHGQKEKGQLEVDSMRGSGGVTITSASQRGNAPASPSALSADQVTGSFAAGSVLRSVTGEGHARIDETTAQGARQTATGNRLQAEFTSAGDGATPAGVRTAELDGNVVLIDQPAPKAGAEPQPPLHATAGKAVYEGKGEWLHLSMSPRVENGAVQLTADRVDVSRQSGDAWARGNVKATWADVRTGAPGSGGAGDAVAPGMTLGGKGPAHVVAEEARLNQSIGEATFLGAARLWQQTNFVSGPVIVLNQRLQTLEAQSNDPSEPVRVVMLSAGNGGAKSNAGGEAGHSSSTPSVIRVRGGELKYSDAARKAVMRAGSLGAVIAETGTATSSSDAVELELRPAGSRDASGATAQGGGAAAASRTHEGHRPCHPHLARSSWNRKPARILWRHGRIRAYR